MSARQRLQDADTGPAPRQIGRYEITGTLGEGAMGIVYRGVDPEIKRPVAIKAIRAQLLGPAGSDSGAAERFRNEARAAGRLNHPNIVSVYDYVEAGAHRLIVMEYVEGCSLLEFTARGRRIPLDDALSIMVQLLDALACAHAQDVCHRDIKPANLLLTRNGKLKVTDFGIARIESAQLTQHGSVIGTPGYMAPERYTGEPTDERVDIFSCGVLLYELLTGVAPFRGSPGMVMNQVLHIEPLPASTLEVIPPPPPQYDAIIARALAKDPGQRYASAAQMRDALREVAARPIAAAVGVDTLIRLRRTDADGLRPQPAPRSANALGDAGTPVENKAAGATHARPSAGAASHPSSVATELYTALAIGRTGAPGAARAAGTAAAPRAANTLAMGPSANATTPPHSATRAQTATPPHTATPARTAPRAATTTPNTSPTTASDTTAWDESLLARLSALLAAQVGPMATLLVRDAARRCNTPAALLTQLAALDLDAAERKAFIAQAGALWSKPPPAMTGQAPKPAAKAEPKLAPTPKPASTLTSLASGLASLSTSISASISATVSASIAASGSAFSSAVDMALGSASGSAAGLAFSSASDSTSRTTSRPGPTAKSSAAPGSAPASVGVPMRSAAPPQTLSRLPVLGTTPMHAHVTGQAQRILARQIGPIAGLIAKRAAAHCETREQFFVSLADAVSAHVNRKALLAQLWRIQ